MRKRKTTIVYECMCMESRKMVLVNLSVGQQWGCRHREQTLLFSVLFMSLQDTVGEGEGVLN